MCKFVYIKGSAKYEHYSKETALKQVNSKLMAKE
jgi:hypothetical protein